MVTKLYTPQNVKLGKGVVNSTTHFDNDYINADGSDGITVTKHLNKKVYEELEMMFIMEFNESSIFVDNGYSLESVEVTVNNYNFIMNNSTSKYNFKRLDENTIHVEKITSKGKVYSYDIYLEMNEDNTIEYRFIWRGKKRKFIDGKKVKMRLYTTKQFGINIFKEFAVNNF